MGILTETYANWENGKHALSKAQQFSIVNVLGLPSRVGVVVELVPVVGQIAQFVDVRLIEDLLRRADHLLATIAKLPEHRSWRESGWIVES
jgi:hypothetical protein